MTRRIVFATSFVLTLLTAAVRVEAGLVTAVRSGDAPAVIGGDSPEYYAPHHGPGNGVHKEHYFTTTVHAHHFAWFSSTPASPGPITIKYDFRPQAGFANLITAGQQANTVTALAAWSAATGGKVVFEQDTVAAAASIINIGTGDLAALGFVSGPGGTLGLGGGDFDHSGGNHAISSGVAWQDKDETWDT